MKKCPLFCDNCIQKIKKLSPAKIKRFCNGKFSKIEKVYPGFNTGNPISGLLPHKKVREKNIKLHQF